MISSHDEPPPRVLFQIFTANARKIVIVVSLSLSLSQVATSRIAEFLAITNRGEPNCREAAAGVRPAGGVGLFQLWGGGGGRENSSDSPAGERRDPLSRRPQRSYRRVGEGCVAADPTTTRAFLHRCTGGSQSVLERVK